MLNIGRLGDAANNEHLKQKLGWQMVNLPLETHNAFQNHYLFEASLQPDKVADMKELVSLAPGRLRCLSDVERKSGPCIIVASGSSLDPIVPRLKDWKGGVMCSTSQASTLAYYGRYPDFIACLDPRDAPQDELAAPEWGNAALIGHVSIPNGYITRFLKRAKGNIYLGRIMEPTYDWYSHHLPAGYPFIRHIMIPMIDSTAAMMGFATWMGYSPIYLAGCDYSGPRFQQWTWSYEKQEWSVDRERSGFDVTINGDQEQTYAMSYSSRGALLSGFMQMRNERYKQRIYQMSQTTILRQFPFRPFEEVLERQGEDDPSQFDRDKVMEDIECNLAPWDTFIVEIKDGWGSSYSTYITNDETRYSAALMQYNHYIKINKEDWEKIEKQFNVPIGELIKRRQISIEAGELLFHAAEEFGDWDWRKMEQIDVPAVIMRRRWLLEEATKRGYTKEGVNSKFKGEAKDAKG